MIAVFCNEHMAGQIERTIAQLQDTTDVGGSRPNTRASNQTDNTVNNALFVCFIQKNIICLWYRSTQSIYCVATIAKQNDAWDAIPEREHRVQGFVLRPQT